MVAHAAVSLVYRMCLIISVVRDKSALERKLNKLEADFQRLEAEHKEKSQQLIKLSQGRMNFGLWD